MNKEQYDSHLRGQGQRITPYSSFGPSGPRSGRSTMLFAEASQ